MNRRKITKDIIEKMLLLKSNGMTDYSVAKELGLDPSNVSYHTNKEYKKKRIEAAKKQKKPRKNIREYMSKYMKSRYNNDKEFRERVRKHSRDYQRKKSSKNKKS